MTSSRAPMGKLATLLFVLALAAPVGAALFRVWVGQQTVQLGYQLSTQTRRAQRLGQLEKQLEVELAAQRAPDHLAKLAEKLGLHQPTPSQVIGPDAKGIRQ